MARFVGGATFFIFVAVAAATLLLTMMTVMVESQQQAPVPNKNKVAEQQQKQELALSEVRFAVFDRDSAQPSGLDSHSLTPGQKLPTKVAVTEQQKMQLSFVVGGGKAGKTAAGALAPHQAFVLLVHQPSGREIVYVAEPDRTNRQLYTFALDMKVYAKDFAGVSGPYGAHLLVGDSALAAPLQWHFADLELKLSAAPAASPESQLPKSSRVNYEPLPEIRHQFRTSEPRPPALVSDTFAAICAAPLLVLLILWLRVGLNFSNIQLSIWALGFHVGLCSIFGLYTCYWLRLDMFQTLKYLALLAVPTLVCGNRLLHGFSVASAATAKKQKPE